MEYVPLNTVSAVDAVCNALEADILNLRFAPGGKITEGDLAVRYGVSRNTIREAVAHLLAQGLLTKIANRGVFVRQFTVDDVKEIFHLRSLLELEAVRAVISAGTMPEHLHSLVSQLEQTDHQDNWDEYVRLDIAFHRGLVAAAGSQRLNKLYDTILTEVKLCIYQTRNYVQITSRNRTSHRIILDAICSNDIDTALCHLKDHISHVTKRYCAGLLAMTQRS